MPGSGTTAGSVVNWVTKPVERVPVRPLAASGFSSNIREIPSVKLACASRKTLGTPSLENFRMSKSKLPAFWSYRKGASA